MKNIIIGFFSIVIMFSCNDSPKKNTQKETTNLQNYTLKGTIDGYLANKVYLNKIIENTFYPIDSAQISNNTFTFEGYVNYPERFALTFENYSSAIIFIVENKNFELNINPNLIPEPTITGSPLNNLLNEYKSQSKVIFSKFELLFPKFQKARLENDVKTLEEVAQEMKIIENEFTEYTYQFIERNSDNYVSAMILRDQLKTTTIDTLSIKKAYHLLSEKVKLSPDAQIISFSLH
jgi:hypothetical protein